jgi:ATP-dependent DNA ligase
VGAGENAQGPVNATKRPVVRRWGQIGAMLVGFGTCALVVAAGLGVSAGVQASLLGLVLAILPLGVVFPAFLWLDRFEAMGLDGVVAKKLGLPYLPGSRDGVVKVKEEKTADCVVVGIRWKGDRETIATLLLGLYRDDGEMDYVGSCAVAARLHDEIEQRALPLLKDAPERRFSEPNRWGTGELEEAAIRPELVVEVRYDKVQGNRFRHGTKFLRWRDDKDPADCTWHELRPPRDPDAPTIDSLLT